LTFPTQGDGIMGKKKRWNGDTIMGGKKELQRLISSLLRSQPQEQAFIQEVAASTIHVNVKITLLRRIERSAAEISCVKMDYERFKKIV